MDYLRKLQKDIANDVCTNMMVENSLKNDLKQTLNKRLEADQLTKLRNDALEHFHKVLAASMEELYKEEKLESKLEELRQLKKDQQRFCTEDTQKGWRPSGDVNQDLKGPRCNALLAHLEDLEDTRNDLEQQIASPPTMDVLRGMNLYQLLPFLQTLSGVQASDVKKNARRKPPSHSPYHALPLRERMEGSAVLSRYCRTLWRRGDRVVQSINEKGWDLLEHPPYSPTEAPTDYHVSRSLKNWLAGKVFEDLDELVVDLKAWIASKNARELINCQVNRKLLLMLMANMPQSDPLEMFMIMLSKMTHYANVLLSNKVTIKQPH